MLCQSTENCTTTEKGGQGTASPWPRAKGHEWRSRLPFISQVPIGKLFFLFKMRKGCLWSTQMSQGWKCTNCSLLLYPIPKPLAKPRGRSVPWRKPGVGQGILQAQTFSGSEDQWMLKLGPSRKKTITKTWAVWVTEELESTALSSATRGTIGTVPPHLGHSWHGGTLLLKRFWPKVGCNSYR